MRVLVNGEARELMAVDENGLEWTEDLMGNHGVFVGRGYNEELGAYEISEDAYIWWEDVIEKMNEVFQLEKELTHSEREEYLEMSEFILDDLDVVYNAKLDWLRERLGK